MLDKDRKGKPGIEYGQQETHFIVWSPQAELVMLHLFHDGHTDSHVVSHKMQYEQEHWHLSVKGDWEGYYYTFQATIDGIQQKEAVDPYARAVGVNGTRGMIINLSGTNPPGWHDDTSPILAAPTDAIIYELHVRDFSIHPQSGISHKGKFLAFCEGGTQCNGLPTGIDHLVELGITHVQLLPVFDFASIDEATESDSHYNWGYDPLNYNAPEGSYATDPHSGSVRITEFKRMVMALHQRGIGVIMDVVYNHTGLTTDSCFNLLSPGSYYRKTQKGTFSNASACGNETASEQPAMRQFMVDSVTYWMREYHIDGFRFDLMGIHDIETMNMIAEAARAINPSVLLYGEGWTAADSPLPESQRAVKANIRQLPGIGVFCDELRDGLKGHWANDQDRGFLSGNDHYKESVKYGITAAVRHQAVNYEEVNYSTAPRALTPQQTINYASCHDNHTLWDKLKLSTDASESALTAMSMLANTIVITSQGIPLLHAGVELLRTKNGDHNSYRSSDAVNEINWPAKSRHQSVFQYYQSLLTLRRSHPVFRFKSAQEVASRLFFDEASDAVLSYRLYGLGIEGETWEWTKLVFNASNEEIKITLPGSGWHIALLNGQFQSLAAPETVQVKSKHALIAYRTT